MWHQILLWTEILSELVLIFSELRLCTCIKMVAFGLFAGNCVGGFDWISVYHFWNIPIRGSDNQIGLVYLHHRMLLSRAPYCFSIYRVSTMEETPWRRRNQQHTYQLHRAYPSHEWSGEISVSSSKGAGSRDHMSPHWRWRSRGRRKHWRKMD